MVLGNGLARDILPEISWATMSYRNFVAYKITCVMSGKQYIGITATTIQRRWSKHVEAARYGRPTRIAAAIRKYGEEGFTIETIASAASRDDLLRLEQLLIAQEETYQHGYNATLGGDGVAGIVRSPETRLRLRQAAKGRKQSAETIAKRVAKIRGRKGWRPTEAQRQRASEIRKGRPDPCTPEGRERVTEGLKGRVFTPEWRAKISAAKKGSNSWSPERRAEHSAKMKGRKLAPGRKMPPRSPEARAKQTATMRARASRTRGDHRMILLADAQAMLLGDWTAAYQQVFGHPPQ